MRILLYVILSIMLSLSISYHIGYNRGIIKGSEGDYVNITVYDNVAEQTDDSPDITASGIKITEVNRNSIIAVSKDLLKTYPFGTTVEILCNCPYDGQIRIVEDTMNKRYKNSIDILTNETKGKYYGKIRRL